MKPARETNEERFRRLAEARVNKILDLFRLLGNLSGAGNYAYTREQVEKIFSTLQLQLAKTKIRFLQTKDHAKKRFSLAEPYEPDVSGNTEDHPAFAIPLPDGTYLRAVGFPNFDYPCIKIYWDNGINEPTEPVCFTEFNPEKEGCQRICIGVYRAEQEDTVYYGPYYAVERE